MDNDWDIPTLRLDMAATALVAPVMKWGVNGRGMQGAGTVHFYADDYKFSRLWLDPCRVPMSDCKVAVEPNFSTHERMSRAEALWGIFRKRFLARVWQDYDVRILVDLNVEPRFRDLALLGVPRGWPGYATRTHRGVPFSEIEADFGLAAEHAAPNEAFFVVFGGGSTARKACRERGWEWVPEEAQVARGIEAAYGTRTGGGRGEGEGAEGLFRLEGR